MARQRPAPTELPPPIIRRARLERLIIYEISEDELEMLGRGTHDSIYLNFAIFLLSVSVSFVIALTTTTIESVRLFTVFVLVASVGGINGIVLMSVWYRNRQVGAELIERIRRRLPAEEIAAAAGGSAPHP